jgi:hypothetical protein
VKGGRRPRVAPFRAILAGGHPTKEKGTVPAEQTRSTAQLSPDERKRLRRSHERLRAASQELEGLVATEPVRGRWEPEPPPPEILETARVNLRRAYEELARCHQEVLGIPVE